VFNFANGEKISFTITDEISSDKKTKNLSNEMCNLMNYERQLYGMFLKDERMQINNWGSV
jgi:hypothetical protein